MLLFLCTNQRRKAPFGELLHVFVFVTYKIMFSKYMWNLVSSKCICDQDCLFLLFLCLNWSLDLIGKDRQQASPSLTFARPEQIAKLLVID